MKLCHKKIKLKTKITKDKIIKIYFYIKKEEEELFIKSEAP
jgi:hypothetical protein